MTGQIQPIRGMNDVLPTESVLWQHLEDTVRGLLVAYGYEEIRVPVVEHTELFKRAIGEFTDVVEKEMYTFTDQGGESLTLRPEATAGVVRAMISNGLLRGARHKVWCMGPMFRHEKPQKGCYRQFHQVDVEAVGFAGPDVDAELIALTARLWRTLGLTRVRLQINSLGTPESRRLYREKLVEYFAAHHERLGREVVLVGVDDGVGGPIALDDLIVALGFEFGCVLLKCRDRRDHRGLAGNKEC